MINKDRANKIKKVLGLNGNDKDSEYYRVADVICDLMHFIDYYPNFKPDHIKLDFEDELRRARNFYDEEKDNDELALPKSDEPTPIREKK